MATPSIAPPRLFLPRARRSPWGLVLSVLAHALLVGAVVVAHARNLLSWPELLAPGHAAAGRPGGGGGGQVRVVALPADLPRRPAAPSAETPRAPPAVLVVEPVEAAMVDEVRPLPEVVSAPTDSAGTGATTGLGGTGSGGGQGSGVGPGSGPGTGPGGGPGSGGGGGGHASPPVPRQLILPPLDYPRSLRGHTVAVTFWVGIDGRVERVVLDPEIEDRGFAKRFIEVMMNYRFRPARSADGAPTAGTTTVSVSF